MALETYRTMFIVFSVITILLVLLVILLFFLFDIRKIISIKTGWAVKRSVRELNEINRKEDNRERKKYKSHSVPLSWTENPAPAAMQRATVKLETGGQETLPLSQYQGTQILQRETWAEHGQKDEEVFDIVERKTILFSNEVIIKK